MKEKEFGNGWTANVDRGPDWLLVRLHAPPRGLGEDAGLADELWSLLQNHFVHRMVLELDEASSLRNGLVDQLVQLQDRLHREGGLLRVCGLSDEHRQVLQTCHVDACFPVYHDRREAIMAPRCTCASTPH